jgi:hypothetical protein
MMVWMIVVVFRMPNRAELRFDMPCGEPVGRLRGLHRVVATIPSRWELGSLLWRGSWVAAPVRAISLRSRTLQFRPPRPPPSL